MENGLDKYIYIFEGFIFFLFSFSFLDLNAVIVSLKKWEMCKIPFTIPFEVIQSSVAPD